jgi:hypothetical protein
MTSAEDEWGRVADEFVTGFRDEQAIARRIHAASTATGSVLLTRREVEALARHLTYLEGHVTQDRDRYRTAIHQAAADLDCPDVDPRSVRDALLRVLVHHSGPGG